jgi:hypothetical protein
MRLKPDGSLDLDWRDQDDQPSSAKRWNQMTVEEKRLQLIEDLLQAYPMLTREQVTDQIDHFF